MILERERNQKETANGRMLFLLRPAVKQLADLHRSGKVHGEIGPESVVIRNHIRFCFPLPENAAKAYTAEQKVFVSLKEPKEENCEQEAGGQETGKSGQSGDHGEGWALFCIPLEQLFAVVPANSGTDVYSMCAVLYQKLTGTEPPDARSRLAGVELKKPSELGVRITEKQETALMKGLSLLGQDRYADAIQLYHGLYEEENTEKKPAQKTDVKETEQQKADKGKENYAEKFTDHTLGSKPGGTMRNGWRVKDDVEAIEKLRSIVFVDFISLEAAEKWDVSEKRDGSVKAWLEKTENDEGECYDLYIGAKGGVQAAENSSGLFQDCLEVEKIFFNGNFDTSQVTDMRWMFKSCGSLSSLDVSGFDTSQVTYMGGMFSGCSSLSSLDVSGFDTSQVTNMGWMFQSCIRLSSLDVSGFDTSQVTNMGWMFAGCGSLSSLDVSGFDTSQVTYMGCMFAGCGSLETLDLRNFNMSSVKNSKEMIPDGLCLHLRGRVWEQAGLWKKSKQKQGLFSHLFKS